MPVYRYLDLSTAHLTEREMNELSSPFSFGDLDNSPRVIVHEYGAWVNVPHHVEDGGSWTEEDTESLRTSRPNLLACIARAHDLDCSWINFDADAAIETDLPTFDW